MYPEQIISTPWMQNLGWVCKSRHLTNLPIFPEIAQKNTPVLPRSRKCNQHLNSVVAQQLSGLLDLHTILRNNNIQCRHNAYPELTCPTPTVSPTFSKLHHQDRANIRALPVLLLPHHNHNLLSP